MFAKPAICSALFPLLTPRPPHDSLRQAGSFFMNSQELSHVGLQISHRAPQMLIFPTELFNDGQENLGSWFVMPVINCLVFLWT